MVRPVSQPSAPVAKSPTKNMKIESQRKKEKTICVCFRCEKVSDLVCDIGFELTAKETRYGLAAKVEMHRSAEQERKMAKSVETAATTHKRNRDN